MGLLSGPVLGLVRRFAERLRFPHLFLVTAALFLLDLLIPDLIPYADELFLALLTLLLGSWRKRKPGSPRAPGAS